MQKQPDRVTALYYRTAHANSDNPHLDNQMQKLLCYAKEQVFDSFIVYADNGYSGLNFDRPAFNALQSDIQAGRIGELVALDMCRISRNPFEAMDFIEKTERCGVCVTTLNDDVHSTSDILADLIAVYLKGGERK